MRFDEYLFHRDKQRKPDKSRDPDPARENSPRTLIEKGGLQKLATATTATIATQAEGDTRTVAEIATVAVANPEKHQVQVSDKSGELDQVEREATTLLSTQSPSVLSLFDWPEDWDSPAQAATIPEKPCPVGHVVTGTCFYCLEPIEAIQPCGLQVRHVRTLIAYGECDQARRSREQKNDAGRLNPAAEVTPEVGSCRQFADEEKGQQGMNDENGKENAR